MRSIKMLVGTALLATAFSGQVYALEVGDGAPCVVLNGVSAEGDAVRGCIRDTIDPKHTHTIIDFFSIYCSTCKKNIPAMNQIAADLKASATVRFVSIDPKEDKVKAFLNSAEIKKFVNFETAFDVDRDAKAAYGVRVTPTTFILDSNNDVVYKHSGLITEEDVAEIKTIILGQ